MAITSLLGRTIHAATHPMSTAAYAVGLVRGTAAALLRMAAGGDGTATTATTATREPTPARPPSGERAEAPEVQVARDLADAPGPAPERAPEPLAEAFTTEPSAATRASAHEGIRRGSAGDDAAIDEWYDDSGPVEADSVVEALQFGDRGEDVDEGELKAILSEAETLRKAAEVDKR